MTSDLYNRCWSALMFDNLEAYEAVIDALSKHLESYPKNVAALHNRGIAYREIGKLDEAEADLRAAAESCARDPLPYKHWGMLLEKKGKQQQALEKYQTGLKMFPSDAPLNRCAAFLLIELGREQEALAHLTKAIRAQRRFRNTYLVRAELYDKFGQRFRAKMDRLMAWLL